MFPLFTSPRGRILSLPALAPVGPVVNSESSSDFLEGETGRAVGVGSAGMENPTTDEVGRVFLVEVGADELPGVEDEEGRRRDAQDFLTRGTAVATAGAGAAVCADCDGADGGREAAGSLDAGAGASGACGPGSLGEAPVRDIDVLVETGDPGMVGVSVVSVTDDEGTVELVLESSCEGDEISSSPAVCCSLLKVASLGGAGRPFTEAAGGRGGERGGVRSSSAPWTIPGGGRALGEMMIPGACDGSSGRRDQMAQLPREVLADASLGDDGDNGRYD